MFFFTILKLDKSAIILISNLLFISLDPFFNASITSRRHKPVLNSSCPDSCNTALQSAVLFYYISDVIHTMYFNTF